MEENAFQDKLDDTAENMSGIEKAETNEETNPLLGQPVDLDDTDKTTSDEKNSADTLAQVEKQLESIKEDLQSLQQGFDSKIKYDANKDRIIDSLHRELQSYREGLHFQIMRPIFFDLITMHDDLTNLSKYHKDGEDDGAITSNLLQSLTSFQDTIESVLERHGVLAFNEPGDRFVPQRQRALHTEATDDLAKDRLVHKRLRKGFEYEGKILRPETVSLYKFIAQTVPENSSKEV